MKNGMLVMKDSPVNLAVPTVPPNVNHHVHEKSNINYSAVSIYFKNILQIVFQEKIQLVNLIEQAILYGK
jgi:hypothetical protein